MAKKSTKTDWDQFDAVVKAAGSNAAQKTDDALATQLAAITSLTQKEIRELFPKQADVETFSQLMQIVKSGTSKNNKINKIVENSEAFAGIILTLLNKVL